MKVDRVKTLNNLIKRQKAIKYESNEDEGAAEHFAEIESCIIAIKSNYSDEAILGALAHVGLDSDLVVL